MKMVKSLLLGSAAGLVAVAGAQAADLPVKAKAVEYVKVCSLYGAGYYYMPGTDICLKLGGVVRYQASANPGASPSNGPLSSGNQHTRTNSLDLIQRTRAAITVDTRQQTAYGTLRTYLLLGYQQDTSAAESPSPSVYMTRGFLQIAGFTFGKATSFFDIMPGASFAYNAGFFHHPDTGDAGKMVAAYTAQFGNGVSATVAMQQAARGTTVYVASAAAVGLGQPGTGPASNNLGGLAAGTGMPDFVGNIRVDQAWGTMMVAAALHNASGGYYGTSEAGGHPGDKYGWAVTGGFVLNLPMIGAGDRLAAAMVYSNGAIKYASVTPTGATGAMAGFNGGSVGYGFIPDAVYGPSPSAIELTTAWSTSAAFEHFWTPAVRTSIYGSYLNVTHTANAKSIICGTACNPDWSAWNIGSRTQWEPVRGLVMGVDVIYSKLTSQTSTTGSTVALAANGAKPAGTYTIADQSAWVGTFRIERAFLP